MTRKNDRDTIIDEIHQTRREIADRFDNDLTAILDDARKRQSASGHPVWQSKSSDKTEHSRGDSSASSNG